MLTYLRNRLNERSTWMLISAGIVTASALEVPWSILAAILAVIGSLTPDGPVKP